jgi:hypothetical protein
VLATQPVGAATFTAWNQTYPQEDLELHEGEYRFRISGRAVQTAVDLDVQVDYFESIDLLTEAGGSCDESAGH